MRCLFEKGTGNRNKRRSRREKRKREGMTKDQRVKGRMKAKQSIGIKDWEGC